MSPVRKLARAVGTTGLGALLATAQVLGTSAASDPSPTDPVASSAPLRLAAYCRSVHGARADAYMPRDLDDWRCSTWHNGVWGLEDVDLASVCHWQAGPDARLQHASGREGGAGDSAGDFDAEPARLLCGP